MIKVLFVFINFATIVCILIYAVRRFLIPALKEKIAQETFEEESLHDEHKQLLITQKHLEESAALQEAFCVSLQEKVQTWKQIVDTKSAERAAQEALDLEETQKRVDTQRQYHTLMMVKQLVAPAVVQDLREQLKSVFSDERKAHEYVQRILRGLK